MHPKKTVPSWLSLAFIVTLMVTAGFGDEDNEFRRINIALEKFSIVYPQQKVYLHLDKTSYKAGEMIWVKAYLLNGLNHLPDTLSTNLYVELISPFETTGGDQKISNVQRIRDRRFSSVGYPA